MGILEGPLMDLVERFLESSAGRAAFGLAIALFGLTFSFIGGGEFWVMVRQITNGSALVTVTNTAVAGPLIGPPITLIGILIGFGRSKMRTAIAWKVLAGITLFYTLACLLIYPFSSIILREVTSSILSAKGYVPSEIERTRPTSSIWTIKWRKTASPPPPRQP
jgi:hypothetical protein